jgi:hypothetical protein
MGGFSLYARPRRDARGRRVDELLAKLGIGRQGTSRLPVVTRTLLVTVFGSAVVAGSFWAFASAADQALAHGEPAVAQRFSARDVAVRYTKLRWTHGWQPDGEHHEYQYGPDAVCQGVGPGRSGREYYRKSKPARVWSHFQCTGPGWALAYGGGPLRPVRLSWILHAWGQRTYESKIRELLE